MKDKKHNETDAREQRRRSVKTILGAGGLVAGAQLGAGEWIKPVVNTVTLPAHAATSGIGFDDSLEDPCFISVVCTNYSEMDISVTGFVVPPTPDIAIDLDIQVDTGSGFESSEDFAATTTDGNGEYSVTESRSQSGITAIRITATLPDFPEAGEAVCTLEFDPTNDDHYGNSYFCEHGAAPSIR